MGEQIARHTPGPWMVGDIRHAGRYQLVIAAGRSRGFVCDVQNPADDDSDDEREANARLIAAAPDLLEALKKAEGYLQGQAIYRQVRAAITKATA